MIMDQIDNNKEMILYLLYASTYMGTLSFEEANVPELEIESSKWNGLLACDDFRELLEKAGMDELFEDKDCNKIGRAHV